MIVAGVFAANYYLGDLFTIDELFNICANMEGHPDNVAPAIYGGFTASYLVGDEYKVVKYNVNSDLLFKVIIPSFEVKTSDARKVLPANLSYHDIVWNLSRIIHLPKALNDGNINLLKELLDDKLHEPYRSRLIDNFDEIKLDVTKNGGCLLISGSGSTMLVISNIDFDINTDYLTKNVSVSDGLKIYATKNIQK